MNIPITIPLINPNEPEALVTALHVREGQHVAQGETLVTLETTKSTNDLTAETSGYIAGLRVQEGQTVRAGELMGYLADTQDWIPPRSDKIASGVSAAEKGDRDNLRITQPARKLANENGIELASLPDDRLVTLNMVKDLIKSRSMSKSDHMENGDFDIGAIIVYGGGGHGKTVIDLLRTLQVFRIAGIVDDGLQPGITIMGVPVLGGSESLKGLFSRGVRLAINAVGGIGNISIRIEVFERLARAGFSCPALIHPSAVVESSASLEAGAQIFARAYVGSEASVGYGCIVNTAAIVSHDCSLGKFSNISPGAILAGEVSVGAGALIGMGATINLQVQVGAGSRIGNGATVKGDVPEKGIVRAGAVWP